MVLELQEQLEAAHAASIKFNHQNEGAFKLFKLAGVNYPHDIYQTCHQKLTYNDIN